MKKIKIKIKQNLKLKIKVLLAKKALNRKSNHETN